MIKAADILRSARDYFASAEDEPKAYTLLSPSDIKAAVPQTSESASYVPSYGTMDDWQRAIRYSIGISDGAINYASEVGDLRLSVLLMAAIRWAGINLAIGRMKVVELDADDKENEITDHPFTALFNEPNPEVEIDNLWKQFAASWILAGECYFLLSRDGGGRIKELWYEPHNTIKPRWDRNIFPEDKTANTSIQYFEIQRGGIWQPWRKMDTFRVYDLFDPMTRRGTNGTDALLRTIFTDNEREQYTATMLRNSGVGLGGVAPKESNRVVDKAALSEVLNRRAQTGDRNKITVFDAPMEYLDMSADYSADAMEKIAHIAESRVAAAIGISVQSLKFLVSQQSSTYNNVREFRKEDFEQWTQPTQETVRKAAQRRILRDMDSNKRHVLKYDYTDVALVQRDRLEVARETEILVRTRTIDQAEARERHDYEFEPADNPTKYKDVWYPVQAATVTLSPIGEVGEINEPDPFAATSGAEPDGAVKPN